MDKNGVNSIVASFAAVFRLVTQRSSPQTWGGALRDKPKNGCEGRGQIKGKFGHVVQIYV